MSHTTTAASGSEARLVRILDRYLAALQEGEVLDKSALLAEHPDLAEDLEACLASLEFIRRAAVVPPAPEAGEAQGQFGSIAAPDVGILGDFRILREIGRGGMGVVYEAEQISLGRRVALKVLPFAATLDPRQLQRFKVEAQAAAQLHHTHIVPVFTVGVERGVHFYAMQFIEGRTLAEVIRELRQFDDAHPPKDPQAADPATPLAPGSSNRTRSFLGTVAELGIQAAEALEYAHSLGVVHRDIKPANLLLDARGSLWVTDFGLAQFHAQPGLTVTGDLVGTLRYMSPEQALGRRGIIDHRTDIYSLGVTLYELLTLRPAFPGDDRQALLRQISEDEPTAPRRLNESIPSELETIVLKAMAKEPGSRYGTARELADDLRRFLDHKPIRAKRPTVWERIIKWGRRHPSVVASTVVSLLLLVVSLAVSVALVGRERNEARAHRERAERRSQQARRAVDEMYTQVAARWLAEQAKLTALQREFLEKALAFYQEFAREEADDPAAERERARALCRVGQIRGRLGQPREAVAALREAAPLWLALVARSGDRPEPCEELAETYAALGLYLGLSGRWIEGADYLDRAATTYEALVAWQPAVAYRSRLVWIQGRLAVHAQIAGRPRRALEAAHSAVAAAEHLESDFPGQAVPRKLHVWALGELGFVLWKTGHYAEAERVLHESIDLARRFPADNSGGSNAHLDGTPSSFPARYNADRSFSFLGRLLLSMDRPREAEAALERALALQEALARESPDVAYGHEEAMLEQVYLVAALQATGRSREAERLAAVVVEQAERLDAEFPGLDTFRSALARGLRLLAQLRAAGGRGEEAEDLFRRALAVAERLAAAGPEDINDRADLGSACLDLGKHLIRRGAPSEAEGQLLRAMKLFDDLATDHPDSPAYRLLLAETHTALGGSLLHRGRQGEAERSFRRARERYEELLNRHVDDPRTWHHAARFFATCPLPHLRDPGRAVALARRAVERAPQEGSSWITLGVVLVRSQDWAGALEALRKLTRTGGDNGLDFLFWAMAHWLSDDRALARAWCGQAVEWMDNNRSRDDGREHLRAAAAALLGRSDAPKPAN